MAAIYLLTRLRQADSMNRETFSNELISLKLMFDALFFFSQSPLDHMAGRMLVKLLLLLMLSEVLLFSVSDAWRRRRRRRR